MTRFNLSALPALTPETDWLHTLAAEEIVERLSVVQRTFEDALVVSRPSPGVAARLAPLRGKVHVAGSAAGAEVVAASAMPFRRAFGLAIALPDLTFGPDPVVALGELRGTLRPDGLFLGAVFGDGTLQELRETLLEAEADLTGGASLRVAPFASTRVWGDALARAGFALPVADDMRLTVRYASIDALIAEMRSLYGRAFLTERRPAPRRLFQRAGELYAARHGDPDGRVRATLSLAFLSGWAPDASQQRPAKRGSATVSLEDALKTF